MAGEDVTEVLREEGLLLLGVVDTTADTPVLSIPQDTGVTITRTYNEFPNLVGAYAGQISKQRDLAMIKIETETRQFNEAYFAAALGLEDGATFVEGGDTPTPELLRSLKYIASRADGKTYVVTIPAGTVGGDFVQAFQRGEYTVVPFAFENVDGAARQITTAIAGGSINATIASGVLTRIAGIGYHKVFGEGGAADDLTSIGPDATPLVDKEVLVLQVGSTAAPITLVHLAGSLVLADLVDFILISPGDSITLEYWVSDTAWHEIGRRVAPVPNP